jgi:hypothetical protein
MDTIAMVLKQAPPSATTDDVAAALEASHNDIGAAIALLWNIQPPKEKPKDKWQEMREICDAYEIEMQKALKGSRL